MTPYAVAKRLNVVLEENGSKNVPPQMIYNYVKKGYIPSGVVEGKLDVTEEDADEFISKFVEKKLAAK